MKRRLFVLLAVFTAVLIPLNICAAAHGQNVEHELTKGDVIKMYMAEGFSVDSTSNGDDSFETPEKALKQLKSWKKKYFNPKAKTNRKPKRVKKGLIDFPHKYIWEIKYKHAEVSFYTSPEPLVYEQGSENGGLNGWIVGKWISFGSTQTKAQVVGDEVLFDVRPTVVFKVVIDGLVLTKTQAKNQFEFTFNLKTRAATARKLF